ncbi:tetratricopeptide repeat protein [Massilia consociata]|uniref:Sel1 repeat family protein n=1 Tax=Massilia consociata TaxID=760117 RepID=A0ABV6FBY9_9BURK
MANREELAIIRNARAGQAAAQLELGKLYLFGSAGLPQSLPTALHWLERAARQDCQQAWQLIGNHIPLGLAQRSAHSLATWYERAYDDGSVHAGLVFAQLVLDAAVPDGTGAALDAVPEALRAKALRALEEAARAGFPDAQWLLARQHEAPAQPLQRADGTGTAPVRPAAQAWLKRAADSGVAQAQLAVLDQAWEAGQWNDYLARALPLARALVRTASGNDGVHRLAPGDIALLSRVARLLEGGQHDLALAPDEPLCFWELAAAEHDRHAQLAMGLRCARMEVDGRRVAGGSGAANFKKAIRWLTLAGEQGLAQAWYALSRIYIKPEFSQRNVADAQRYLERAAEMGYREAQLECGNNAWRARRENENNDVRAVYWLQKAAAQGASEAVELLRKIAPRLSTPPYVDTGKLLAKCHELGRRDAGHRDGGPAHPLLAARLELAALFNLSRAEALLLDIPAADHGHCLVIDIRASYGRSKRRLVLVETAQERHALDRIARLFEGIDCGPSGPEGNYRQRLYRLRTLLGAAAKDGEGEEPAADFGLAA